MGDRETAASIFQRQEREREMFFVDLARLLDDADYDWKLPESFMKRLEYDGNGILSGEGLIIRDDTEKDVPIERASIVFSRKGNLFTMGRHGVIIPHQTHDYEDIFSLVEQKVNETLATLKPVTANP